MHAMYIQVETLFKTETKTRDDMEKGYRTCLKEFNILRQNFNSNLSIANKRYEKNKYQERKRELELKILAREGDGGGGADELTKLEQKVAKEIKPDILKLTNDYAGLKQWRISFENFLRLMSVRKLSRDFQHQMFLKGLEKTLAHEIAHKLQDTPEMDVLLPEAVEGGAAGQAAGAAARRTAVQSRRLAAQSDAR